MQRYISPIDWRTVGAQLLAALRLLGAVLALPLVISLIFKEFAYSWIFGGLALGLFLGGYLGTKRLSQAQELELKEALVITALAYLLFALVGALPFLREISFINGLFEALSGFTTTGLSVLDPARLPKTLLFFRSYMQWIGGAGIIVLSLAILLRPGGAAFRLYSAEFGQENIVGSVVATARVVLHVYLILSVLNYIAYIAVGMGPFDALLNAFSTISTGGFSPWQGSIGHYQSTLINLVTIIFMWIGALSFPLWYLARAKGPKKLLTDRQLHYLLSLSLFGGFFLMIGFGLVARNVVPGLFQAVTALTTTGFNISDQEQLSAGAKLVTIILMIIGGASGSTAGGIKLFRLIILLRLLRWLFLRPLLPEEAKLPIKYGGGGVSDRELKAIAAFVLLYLAILIIAALILMLSGYGFADALFEAASAQGTVGLSVGITSPTMPTLAKLVLMLLMWLGRLEIIPVLIALYPGIWFRLRRG